MQVSFEAPPGVRQNLQRTYSARASAASNSPVQEQLLFMLAWFHAIVQERRSYIPEVSFVSAPCCYSCC